VYDLLIEEEKARASNDDVDEYRFPDVPTGEGKTEGDASGEAFEIKGPGVEVSILRPTDGEELGLIRMDYVAVEEDGDEDEQKGFGSYEKVDGEWRPMSK
jgi:hypothetical protein